MRSPVLKWGDVIKAWRKLSKMCVPNTGALRSGSAEPRVTVCQPLMLPYSSVGPIRRFNAHSVIRNVYSRVRALDGSPTP